MASCSRVCRSADAIKAHDEIVRACEEKMDEVDDGKRKFLLSQRVFEVSRGLAELLLSGRSHSGRKGRLQ